MDINEKSIKLLSTIGSRASFGMGTLDLVKKNKDLMVVTCDVSTSAGLDRFRKTFQQRIWRHGIRLARVHVTTNQSLKTTV